MKNIYFLIVLCSTLFSNDVLLIGISNYKDTPLPNPVNDIKLIEKAFIKKGWDVQKIVNPRSSELKRSVENFFISKTDSDKPVLVYFAGHGFQLLGENYLVPILDDKNIIDFKDVVKNCLSVSELNYYSRTIYGAKIFVVDACRDSPLGDDMLPPSAGLNSQYANPNSIIAYATSPGKFAFDGPPNYYSPYAESFYESILVSETFDEAFKKTRIGTMTSTNGEQLPWESSSLFYDIFLNANQTTDLSDLNEFDSKDEYIDNKQKNNFEKENRKKIEDFEDLVNHLILKVNNASKFSFYKDRSISYEYSTDPERVRSDAIEGLKDEIRRYKRGNRGALYAIGRFFQVGKFNTPCRRGNSLDFDCSSANVVILEPDLELSLKLAKIAYDENFTSSLLADHYRNGWGVKKDLLKAYDLYMEDRYLGGEYYWTDINRMIQTELNNLGENLSVDGAFGPNSCSILKKYIGYTNCKKTVTREQVLEFVSRYQY